LKPRYHLIGLAIVLVVIWRVHSLLNPLGGLTDPEAPMDVPTLAVSEAQPEDRPQALPDPESSNDSSADTPAAATLAVIGTLMIPMTIILVPVYLVVTELGLANSLWAVILPGAATPTGVFLLRQYMLTLPRDLIEAARMDKASEWQIYWRIVMPLTLPALAVLAIFSIMWRWNEFLWPLAVLTKTEVYTLQIGLNAFQGELQTQWHYLLAMTVVTLIPIALVFVFLQRFITTGIGSTGMK